MTSKKFCHTVKPFLANNGCISKDFIGTENERNLTCNKQELVELFNEHYINTGRKVLWQKPLSPGNSSDTYLHEMTVKEIISVYSNHPSIQKTKNLCGPENKFDLPQANTSRINKIIKSINVNKTKGPDGVSTKFV